MFPFTYSVRICCARAKSGKAHPTDTYTTLGYAANQIYISWQRIDGFGAIQVYSGSTWTSSIQGSFTVQDVLNNNVRFVPNKNYFGTSASIAFIGTIYDPQQTAHSNSGSTPLTVNFVNQAPVVQLNQVLTGYQGLPVIISSKYVAASDVDNTDDQLIWFLNTTLVTSSVGVIQVLPLNGVWTNYTAAGVNVTQTMVDNAQMRFVGVDTFSGPWVYFSAYVCDPYNACTPPFTVAIQITATGASSASSNTLIIGASVGSIAGVAAISGAAAMIMLKRRRKEQSKEMSVVVGNQNQQTNDMQFMMKLFAEGFMNLKKEFKTIHQDMVEVKMLQGYVPQVGGNLLTAGPGDGMYGQPRLLTAGPMAYHPGLGAGGRIEEIPSGTSYMTDNSTNMSYVQRPASTYAPGSFGVQPSMNATMPSALPLPSANNTLQNQLAELDNIAQVMYNFQDDEQFNADGEANKGL
jgi:hypothetical protein